MGEHTPTAEYEPPLIEEPFWSAARDGKLRLQRCADCGKVRFPPAAHCTCSSGEYEWTDVGGGGTIWSWAVVHHPYAPSHVDQIPYTVAMVELDEGPKLIGRLWSSPEAPPAINARVEVVFDDAEGDRLNPPTFRLAER